MSNATTQNDNSTSKGKTPRSRRRIIFALKLVFSLGMLFVIFRKVLSRDGVADIGERLVNLHWGWVVAAIGMQLCAIAFSTVRWQRLLVGQGIFARWRFLASSIMIARFWGAFTPGGFTGFGGWRIYDVAKHTGKTARATATIGVEMVLGQLAFGVVVMLGSFFGARFIGVSRVMAINAIFISIIVIGLVFLARPWMFLFFTRWLPTGFRLRVQTLIDAVAAYGGKSPLLAQAAALGVGTHAFNNFIYVCAARALGVELGVGEVFFASSLQILATLFPGSINGIGLREAAAVALYTSPAIGLPISVAVLIPTVGFACEMFVSAFGGLIFLSRKVDYQPEIRVEEATREAAVHAQLEKVPIALWPKTGRAILLGLAGGLSGGLIAGILEASLIAFSSSGASGTRIFAFGAIAYALIGAMMGAGVGGALAWIGRRMQREACPESTAFGGYTAMVFASLIFALGAFRIRRDVFHEELAWKSPKGLFVLLVCMVAASLIYFLMERVVSRWARSSWGAWALKGWTLGLALVITCALLWAVSSSPNTAVHTAQALKASDQDQAERGNILFIVVDTLRADHLPAYGYQGVETPHLDAFIDDAVRFDQAFVTSSWTRPSFASLLTGRLASSHGVMAKSDALPSTLTTLPEALKQVGYQTAGFVTNYNVAPYFNFHQGFDEYHYLEPEFVLGADDASVKLLAIQFLRQRVEKWRARRDRVDPGGAYQDAETVNRVLSEWFERAPRAPWFAFVGYMDPHDPYFPHPYDGSGYARAAHPKPSPEEAPRLRALYDGEIHYWDTHFGQLLADLKSRGLYDDLTIVVTSDHGEEFHDHGGFWHGTTLYDEQLRVPLIVKFPAYRRGGTVVRHWVRSIDLMPSLLSEMKIPIPEGVQGGSLFEGTEKVFAEESHEGNVLESLRMLKGTDEIKLITANPGNPRKLETVELYRVDEDPGEQKNLAAGEPLLIKDAMGSLVTEKNRAVQGAVAKESVSMDEDVAERLKALGYIEESDP